MGERPVSGNKVAWSLLSDLTDFSCHKPETRGSKVVQFSMPYLPILPLYFVTLQSALGHVLKSDASTLATVEEDTFDHCREAAPKCPGDPRKKLKLRKKLV